MRAFRLSGGVVLALASLVFPSLAAAQNDLADVQVQMAEARRHFDALEYEQAVPALDRSIAILSARRRDDTVKILSNAYEMRARARFGLGDQNGAREDLVSLLRVDPGHVLTGQISPRVVTMFEEAQKSTTTSVRLVVNPPTAEVQLDGITVKANATIPVIIGEHTLTAKQLGYRPGSATFTANPGSGSEATLELARTSAVLSIVTSPPDVDVFVDGVARGKTAGGPAPADYAPRAARAGVPLSALSAVLVLPDVGVGNHRIEFRRACYVQAERRVDITQLQDVVLDPVKLESAISTIVAQSTRQGTTVLVDGQDRGPAPYTAELCEGEHTVELRSPYGRYIRRIDTRPGQKLEVTGAMRPAFALVSASTGGPLNTDLRLAVERALDPVRSILVFAPPADRVDQTLKSSQLPPDWLLFDGNRRPMGLSSEITAPMRRDLSTKIAKAFDAQGVASVSIPSPINRNRVVVSLLGAGSAEPDVIELSLDRPDTIADAVAQLDRPMTFFRPSLSFTTIDVADIAGAVVLSVASGAGATDVQQGDVIVRANGQAVGGSAALAALLAPHAATDSLSLELKDKTGAVKKADVKVVMAPRLLGMSDQTLLANRALVDLRSRLAAPGAPGEESIVRLNLAAALARLQAWSEARAELQQVKLPEGPGVGDGTVQYLLGVCSDNLGNRAEAETAWRAAAASESWMTEDGPPVKALAEARLAELQRRQAR